MQRLLAPIWILPHRDIIADIKRLWRRSFFGALGFVRLFVGEDFFVGVVLVVGEFAAFDHLSDDLFVERFDFLLFG